MAELISIAGNYPATEFDTLIPQLTDPANIREAFLAYHFGVENFDGNADVPAADSIHGHIESFKANLAAIGASAVLTIGGTANQITTSASAGFVTVGLPNNIIAPNNLTVTNDLTVNNNLTVNGDINLGDDLNITGDLSVTNSITTNGYALIKEGVNIFANLSDRNTAIPSPSLAAEGLVVYLQDTNSLSVFNGSSWENLESHGSLGDRIGEVEVLALLGL